MRAHLPPSAFLAALAVCTVLGISPAADAQPAPSGPLFWIDRAAPSYYDDLKVAAGPDGGFATAWVEVRPDEAGSSTYVYTVRARRFDATGSRLGPAVSLAETADWADVDLAVDRTGEALAVWFDGGSDIKGRRLDSAGRPLGRPILLDADPELAPPLVAAHPAGGFLVAWKRGGQPLARRVFTDGTLGPTVRLPRSLRSCYSGFPIAFDMAVSRQGDVAVVCDRVGGPILQLLDPRLSPRGDALPIPIPVSSREGTQGFSVEFGSGDELAVTWMSFGEKDEIFARRYSLKRGWIGPLLPVTAEEQVYSEPVIAADPGGGYLVLWSIFTRETTEILGRRIEPSGRLGPTFPLDPDSLGAGTGGLIGVAAQKAGGFIVAWIGRYGLVGQRFASDSPGQIELRRPRSVALEGGGQALLEAVRREGTRGEVRASWSALGQSATPGEDFDDTSGTVTFADGDSQPKLIAVPLQDDGRPEGDESFQVVLHQPEGAKGGATLGRLAAARVEIRDDDTPSPLLAGAGPPVQIEELPPADRSYLACCLDLAGLSTGGFVAAWQLESGPGVEYALFDAAGQPVTAGSASGPPQQVTPRLLPQPDGGFILIWFSDYEGLGPEAQGWFAQRFDAEGEPLDQQIPLPSFRPSPLRAAPVPEGGFIALGFRRAGPSLDLIVERHDANGRPLGEPARVNETPILDPYDFQRGGILDGAQLHVAASTAGTALVVWSQLPLYGQTGGIFARLVSASGAPLGHVIAVGGTADALRRLFVAAAPGGGFTVVWESNRDGNGWGITARWLDASGSPLGGEVIVNSSTAGDQTRPRAAFDSTGDLLIIWRNESALQGQLFSGPGQREGNEFLIDDGSGSLPATPALAATGPGKWQVLWSSIAADASHGSMSTRRLARPGE